MITSLPPEVFRVTKSTYATSAAKALSGVGGLHDDGRWHTKGHPIVYTAQSSTLCLLERLVHADEWIADRHPDRVMLTLTLPPVSWTGFDASELQSHDPHWRIEGSLLCKRLGDHWISSGRTCCLVVPSAANPGDYNLLLNPAHSDFQQILSANTVLRSAPVELDERIVSLALQRRSAGA
jgi:RES domain-containing protein